jgi:hypothetical protein
MSRVLVWKCDSTGKLFEDQKKYKSHLAKLARQRREQRKIQIENDIAQSWWTAAQNREMSIADLPQFIIENQKHFWAEAARHEWDWDRVGKRHRGVVCPVPELVWFTEFNLLWSDEVSNSHTCPHNGVTNWGGREKLPDGTPAPRGYPGWTGRMEWRVKWPKEWDGTYLGSDLFKGRRCRIYSGTGGGGHYRDGCQTFGYGVEIFAADWPGLARFREKELMWRTLGTPAQNQPVLA